MTNQDVETQIQSIPTWYHVITLDGVQTPGIWDLRTAAERYGFPKSLAGATVLDVGSSNGFFSFHMEKLGASEVMAAELPEWTDHDCPAWCLDVPEATEPALHGAIDTGQVHAGFNVAHRILGSRVRKVRATIADLPEHFEAEFDLVLCSRVLSHIRDPLGALEVLHSLLVPGGQLILAVAADISRPGKSYANFVGDPTRPRWWLPSPEALVQMCRAMGFQGSTHVDTIDISARVGPPDTTHLAIVHAWREELGVIRQVPSSR